MPRSANHKTAENDATVTLLLYKEHSMHIDVYEAIQLTVIVLFSILLRRNIFRSSNAGETINRIKLGAQSFSRAREPRAGQWDRK